MRNAATEEFSRRLNEALATVGIPVHGRAAELARLTGQTNQGTCKWVNGDGFPSVVNMARIALQYGISLDWLLLGVGPTFCGKTSNDEMEIIQAIRRLDDRGKMAVKRTIETESTFCPPGLPVRRETPRAICEMY